MKTKWYFIVGVLLFLAGGITPPIYRKFISDQRDSDSSETILICITALMVILSVAFILAGVVRLNNESSSKDGLNIYSSE